MKPLVTPTAVIVSLACLSPAAAQTAWTADGGARNATVRYADLDLASPAGVAALNARIERAARVVCSPAPSIRELKNDDLFRACVTAAKSSAAQASSDAVMMARAVRDNPPSLVAETK